MKRDIADILEDFLSDINESNVGVVWGECVCRNHDVWASRNSNYCLHSDVYIHDSNSAF